LAVLRVARQASDVTLLINNAGIATHSALITGDLDAARQEMDTHFWGTVMMIRAFAPILAANGGGAILNLLSVLSWRTFVTDTAYGAAKAAAWSLTDGARLELAEQRTQVTGLFVGAVDTQMMAGYTGPMQNPAAVVTAGIDGIAAGVDEVLADSYAEQAKGSLGQTPRERYPELEWSPAITSAA
jgi:NAD(P)-dependent dehydrogenase (short-subunit alcohol dehydrogenase family)